jgi:P27 family predicted phage terminase small subunit
MPRGRPRKPTKLKKAQGTLQKCRTLPNEWTPPPGAPPEPADLDKVGRKEWRRVVEELTTAGVLTKIDASMLEGYCSMFSQALTYRALAQAEPIIASFTGPKVNPAAEMARKSWALARQFAAEFGMTPAARSRVAAAGKDDDDEEDNAFLFGGGLKVVNGGKEQAAAPTRAARPTGGAGAGSGEVGAPSEGTPRP